MRLWPFGRGSKAGGPPETVDPSSIANGVTIVGNISTAGELQIDGAIRGDVRAQLCIVDQLGVIEGRLSAEEVVVYGRVIGPIHGIRVHLHGGAYVEGDIYNETVTIEHGAHVDGAIRRCDNPLNVGSSKRQQAALIPAPSDEPVTLDNYRPLRAIRPR